MKLPDVAGNSNAPSLSPSMGVASYGVSRNQSGETIAGAGQDIQQASQIVAATNARQDALVAQDASNKLAQVRMAAEFDTNAGFRNVKEGGVIGQKFTDTYNDKFKNATQQIRDALENDDQKKLFDRHADIQNLQFKSALLQHQSQETDKFNDSTDNSTLNNNLQSMATRPMDELNFQQGITAIGATLDSMGERKHLPAQQIAELKSKYLTAAYTTRITSIMNGIPGVVDPDPHLAEAMFKQVQSQLGPQAQVQLAEQVKKSNNDWTDTTIAKTMIFGGGPGAKNDSGLPANPTANDLKVDLGQRVQAALDLYPNDPLRGRALASKVENYGRMVISNQAAEQASARDMLVKGMIGTKPDGSDAPLTVDQLLRNPDSRRAWDSSTPETKQAIQNHFKNGGGSPPRTQETQNILYQYMGMAANDREGFANADLSNLIPKLPYQDFDKLAGLQLAARNRAERDGEKAANLQHALTLSLNYALKPLGIGVPTQGTSSSKREQYDQFTGRLAQWMDDYKTANGKNPTDQDIIKQSKSLTATLTVPGTLWNSDKPGFTLTPEEEAKATIKLTPEQSTSIKSSLQGRYGFEPTESMIQQAAVLNRLYPNDLKRLRQFDQTMKERAKKGAQK